MTTPETVRQHLEPVPRASGRTWTVTTASGSVVTGHLPEWAEEDPSQSGVPAEQLGRVLADICHRAVFPGQMVLAACDGGAGRETVIFGGSMEFHPYTGNAEVSVRSAGVPVAHLQIVDDYWIHDLDPFALATLAVQLRAQADHLDDRVRPALTAARRDWVAAHSTTRTVSAGGRRTTDRPAG